jgi:hypothetical protein
MQHFFNFLKVLAVCITLWLISDNISLSISCSNKVQPNVITLDTAGVVLLGTIKD